MNTSPSLNKEREAFEAWRRRTAKTANPDKAVALNGFGDDAQYDVPATRAMWAAWQARAALASTPSALPVEGATPKYNRAREMADEVMAELEAADHVWNEEDIDRVQGVLLPRVYDCLNLLAIAKEGAETDLQYREALHCLSSVMRAASHALVSMAPSEKEAKLRSVLAKAHDWYMAEVNSDTYMGEPAIVGTPSKEGAAQVEAVAWDYRHLDTANTPNKWSEWTRCEPRNPYTDTAKDYADEIQRYIDRGYKYQLRALYTAPPASPSEGGGEPTERTPRDFAIEHAEYMAKDAERMISAVNDLALAESEHEDGTANESDVDAARETVSEAQRSLTSGIYEFRKRRDRALSLIPIEAVDAAKNEIADAFDCARAAILRPTSLAATRHCLDVLRSRVEAALQSQGAKP